MIVCHCEVVSDRHIRREIAQGAASLDEVVDACGAGAHCGSCRPTISALLVTLATERRAQPAA